MIRPIDIRLNAAHPELPLAEAVTFTGAPSTVLIRGVPPNCGRWAITAVFVAATYPDGSTTTRAAVQSANGVWVATLPATARSGRTENGLRVMADGIDENGAAVTGYILGVADFAVASLAVTPAPQPGETSWQMLYFDAVPGTLRKGDVAKVDGVLKLYNGTAWEAFAGDIPAPSTATPAMDGTGAAGTSEEYARGDHVHPTDTSRMAASATGADIAVSGSDATKIDAALAGKASKADLDPLLFAQYYPEGNVKSAAEFTAGIKYDDPDTTNRMITVKPFCNTQRAGADNSSLVGRVVIPPFVDAQGNPYISDDGTRYKVVGVSGGISNDENANLTAVVAPNTVTSIGDYAFDLCAALVSVSLPTATSIVNNAFSYCTSLASVDFGDTPRSSVPSLGYHAFYDVPTTCKIIVPYTQYDAWKAASGWSSLPQEFVRHPEKADKPTTFTAGNLAALDLNGNPVDSGKKPSDFQSALSAQQLANIAAVSNALAFDATHSYAAGDPVVYNGTLYTFTTTHTGAWTGSDVSAVDIIATLAGKLDKSDLPYAIVTPAVTTSGTSASATFSDRASNVVMLESGITEAHFTFPARTQGRARDFFVRLVVQGATPPTLYFTEPTGGEVAFDADSSGWSHIDSGVNLLMFTDTAE